MLAERGLRGEALAVCRQLLDEPTVGDDAALGTLERLADDGDDVETLRLVFERRVSLASSPHERARALERLGDFLDGWPQDTAGAARSWKAAAEQYLALPGHAAEATRLFERALDEAPEDVEAVTRLIDLYATAGKWRRLPELYGLLLRRSQDTTDAIELLLSLHPRASARARRGSFRSSSTRRCFRSSLAPTSGRSWSRGRAFSRAPGSTRRPPTTTGRCWNPLRRTRTCATSRRSSIPAGTSNGGATTSAGCSDGERIGR